MLLPLHLNLIPVPAKIIFVFMSLYRTIVFSPVSNIKITTTSLELESIVTTTYRRKAQYNDI